MNFIYGVFIVHMVRTCFVATISTSTVPSISLNTTANHHEENQNQNTPDNRAIKSKIVWLVPLEFPIVPVAPFRPVTPFIPVVPMVKHLQHFSKSLILRFWQISSQSKDIRTGLFKKKIRSTLTSIFVDFYLKNLLLAQPTWRNDSKRLNDLRFTIAYLWHRQNQPQVPTSELIHTHWSGGVSTINLFIARE